MTKTQILSELRDRNIQLYDLELGFDKFETRYFSNGSCYGGDLRFENFEWQDKEGNNIKVEIAIETVEISKDVYDFIYHLR